MLEENRISGPLKMFVSRSHKCYAQSQNLLKKTLLITLPILITSKFSR